MRIWIGVYGAGQTPAGDYLLFNPHNCCYTKEATTGFEYLQNYQVGWKPVCFVNWVRNAFCQYLWGGWQEAVVSGTSKPVRTLIMPILALRLAIAAADNAGCLTDGIRSEADQWAPQIFRAVGWSEVF